MTTSDATSSAWVHAKLDEVLRGHDDDTVARAFPVVVMMLADAYGADRLDPDMQDILRRIGHRIGLRDGMDEAEARHLTAAYVEGLKVDAGLLRSLKAVLAAHEAAGEASTRRRARRLDLGFARPAMRAQVGPRTGVPSSQFAAQATGMIRLR